MLNYQKLYALDMIIKYYFYTYLIYKHFHRINLWMTIHAIVYKYHINNRDDQTTRRRTWTKRFDLGRIKLTRDFNI